MLASVAAAWCMHPKYIHDPGSLYFDKIAIKAEKLLMTMVLSQLRCATTVTSTGL